MKYIVCNYKNYEVYGVKKEDFFNKSFNAKLKTSKISELFYEDQTR